MRTIMSALLTTVLLLGCATESATNRQDERSMLRAMPSAPIDPNTEEIKSLQRTVSLLRSEVAELADRIRRIQARPPLSTYKLPETVSICGEKVPLEDRRVWENLDQEFLVSLGNEAQVLLWMKRARRYFPLIEKRLRELSLPDDLKYVTITESSLRPIAVSHSGAAGIWQFIPATGERFGMRGSGGVDERFDFLKATEGALAYLKALYDEFNSWTLALAAYNAGENRIRKEINSQRTRNYFYLSLPLETERYVYKIAVAKTLLSSPDRFGFSLGEKDLYNPVPIERVQIQVPLPLSLVDVAAATGQYFKQIKEINPHFSSESIPAGNHFLNLPLGTSEQFWSFFNTWKKECESNR